MIPISRGSARFYVRARRPDATATTRRTACTQGSFQTVVYRQSNSSFTLLHHPPWWLTLHTEEVPQPRREATSVDWAGGRLDANLLLCASHPHPPSPVQTLQVAEKNFGHSELRSAVCAARPEEFDAPSACGIRRFDWFRRRRARGRRPCRRLEGAKEAPGRGGSWSGGAAISSISQAFGLIRTPKSATT